MPTCNESNVEEPLSNARSRSVIPGCAHIGMAVRLLLCMAVWCGFGHASHALMSTVVRSSAPSLSSQDLQQNAEMHMAELKASAELGYQRISKVPDPPKSLSGIRPFYVPPHATGIGPACPFATSLPANSEGNLPLVFEGHRPTLLLGGVPSDDR